MGAPEGPARCGSQAEIDATLARLRAAEVVLNARLASAWQAREAVSALRQPLETTNGYGLAPGVLAQAGILLGLLGPEGLHEGRLRAAAHAAQHPPSRPSGPQRPARIASLGLARPVAPARAVHRVAGTQTPRPPVRPSRDARPRRPALRPPGAT